MARIRTIKPEFQNSQSMGRVSRDARLTFIELWPQCDDAGRIRANSRMLASVLFPYDEDAPSMIDSWLSELEREGCIVRYKVEQDEYLAIIHWDHQKIDHPQPSKLPIPPSKKRTKTKLSVREDTLNVRDPVENVSALSGPVPGSRNGKDQEGISLVSADADETAVLDAFNSVASDFGWSKAQRITSARRTAIKQRLRECGGIDGWRAAMAKARGSPFLRGETGRDKSHEKWSPDLDFFLKQSTFTKLMEGKYDDRGSNAKPTGIDAVIAGGRAALAGNA